MHELISHLEEKYTRIEILFVLSYSYIKFYSEICRLSLDINNLAIDILTVHYPGTVMDVFTNLYSGNKMVVSTQTLACI